VHADHRLHFDDAGSDLDEPQAQSVELKRRAKAGQRQHRIVHGGRSSSENAMSCLNRAELVAVVGWSDCPPPRKSRFSRSLALIQGALGQTGAGLRDHLSWMDGCGAVAPEGVCRVYAMTSERARLDGSGRR
jgi:hypothetical protein